MTRIKTQIRIERDATGTVRAAIIADIEQYYPSIIAQGHGDTPAQALDAAIGRAEDIRQQILEAIQAARSLRKDQQ